MLIKIIFSLHQIRQAVQCSSNEGEHEEEEEATAQLITFESKWKANLGKLNEESLLVCCCCCVSLVLFQWYYSKQQQSRRRKSLTRKKKSSSLKKLQAKAGNEEEEDLFPIIATNRREKTRERVNDNEAHRLLVWKKKRENCGEEREKYSWKCFDDLSLQNMCASAVQVDEFKNSHHFAFSLFLFADGKNQICPFTFSHTHSLDRYFLLHFETPGNGVSLRRTRRTTNNDQRR